MTAASLTDTARELGHKPAAVRQLLRRRGLITSIGELPAHPEAIGRLFVEQRTRWNSAIGGYSHYGVVMVTPAGRQWLAKLLAEEAA